MFQSQPMPDAMQLPEDRSVDDTGLELKGHKKSMAVANSGQRKTVDGDAKKKKLKDARKRQKAARRNAR